MHTQLPFFFQDASTNELNSLGVYFIDEINLYVYLEQACPLLSGSTYRSEPLARPGVSPQHLRRKGTPALAPEGNKLVLMFINLIRLYGPVSLSRHAVRLVRFLLTRPTDV